MAHPKGKTKTFAELKKSIENKHKQGKGYYDD